jgi:hypothetical protein
LDLSLEDDEEVQYEEDANGKGITNEFYIDRVFSNLFSFRQCFTSIYMLYIFIL